LAATFRLRVRAAFFAAVNVSSAMSRSYRQRALFDADTRPDTALLTTIAERA
jgi:hypothetical protein